MNRTLLRCRYFSTALGPCWLSVKEALSSTPRPNSKIKTQGWIKSLRQQKNMIFIDINDGSCLKNLQAVSAADTINIDSSSLTVGTSIEAEGTLTPSNHPKQSIELDLSSISILGPCDPNEYPFKPRMKHDLEYTRQFPHLRPRTNIFSSALRVRNSLSMEIHNYFQKQGYILVHTPLITSSDCEGAGDLFQVCPPGFNGGASSDGRSHFFGVPTYLTVSGQLHAEAMACGMSKVYTFGPTFRAENSHTRRHLSEFYMVEAEMVTCSREPEDCLEEVMKCCEDLCKTVVEKLMKSNSDDVNFVNSRTNNRVGVNSLLDYTYARVTYEEAVDILSRPEGRFENPAKHGDDLASEHEKYLIEHFGNRPVFVTEFPTNLKPFYAKTKEDGKTTLSMDLLIPSVGEVIGGTVREERLDILEHNLKRLNMDQNYQWYLDLRRYGTVPHGGFGLGLDRLLQVILGLDNIRDVIPFPRCSGSSPM